MAKITVEAVSFSSGGEDGDTEITSNANGFG